MSNVETDLPAPVQDAIRNARASRDRINEIANRLALAANATDTVRRNYAANQLVEQYKDSENFNVLSASVDKLSSLFIEDDELVAAYTQYRKLLNDKFGERVRKVLDEKAKQVPSQPLEKTEQEALETERMQQASLYKAYKSIISAMGQQIPEDLKADIIVRRGGKRGPEIQGSYSFSVEKASGSGEFNDPQTKLSVIANTVTGWRTADLKKFILENVSGAEVTKNSEGKEVVSLPDTFEVTLPEVNRKLRGVKVSAVTAPDQDDDEDDEEVSEDDLA